MAALFHTLLYVPVYNLLVFLVGVLPGDDLGLAVVGATLLVKILMMPLSLSAVRTTRGMQALQPALKEIEVQYKDDKEARARETFALYKQHNINPFASVFTLLLQFPILLALYFVVQSKSLRTIDSTLLYPFVHLPPHLTTQLLGLFAVAGPSLVLALLATLTQLAQAWYAIPIPAKKPQSSMQDDFGRVMALQARAVIPLVIGVVSYTSGAIALYFITSNLIMLAQEFIARRVPHPSTKVAS